MCDDLKRKKVFLLNTHLDNILNAPEELIEHLERIFDYFKNDDRVVLLWRPHPLSKSTISLKSRNLLDRYEKLIEKFIQMPQTIYDESEDLHRAIAVSDCYIGDLSSLVKLYEAAKKPAMVLSPIRSNQYSYMCLQFHAGAQKGDWVYFSAINFNGFFKLSLITGEIAYLGRFKREELKQNLHGGAYIQEDFCWFFPKFGTYIVKIDLNTLEQQFINCFETLKFHDEYKFIDYVIDGHDIWLIPKGSAAILKFNLITEEFVIFDNWPEALFWDKDSTPFSSAVLLHDKLIICPCDLEDFIILDTQTGNMITSAEKIPCQTYSGIAYDGRCLWLSPLRGDHILKWDVEHGVGEKIGRELADFSQDCNKFAAIYYFGGYIWLLPYHLEAFLRINPETNEITEVRRPEDLELKMDRRLGKSFIGRVTSNTELMFTSPYANMLLRVEQCGRDHMSGIRLRISDEQYVTYVSTTNECRLAKDRRWYEIDYYYPIKKFIDQVTGSTMNVDSLNEGKKTSDHGAAIWNYTKQVLLWRKNRYGAGETDSIIESID